MVNLEDLKEEARRLLKEEKVQYIIGYEKSSATMAARPLFMKSTEDVDRLIWSPTCYHNLTRFLVDEKRKRDKSENTDKKPVGVIVKGCDSRAINVLLQENYLNRDEIFIIGVSCEKTGMISPKKIPAGNNGNKNISFGGKLDTMDNLADRCLECFASHPVVYDILFGEKTKRSPEEPFKSIEKMEERTTREKWDFWKEEFDKCIRCYACRSVCPMCYCEECVVDTINFAVTAETSAAEKAQKIKWIERSSATSENSVYHLVRAMHLAGRCIDCGECQRVCPADIPIRLLNKKLEKDAKDLFDYDVGFDPTQPSLVSAFRDDDPEDFIR